MHGSGGMHRNVGSIRGGSGAHLSIGGGKPLRMSGEVLGYGKKDVRVAGNWSGRNVDPECADGEEGENGFGEHDDGEGCKGEQITTAPGLRLERL